MPPNDCRAASPPTRPAPLARRMLPMLLCGLALATLAACATPPPASDPDAVADFRETNDPIEPTNRVFYAVNNGIDTVLLRPVATAYRDVVPEAVRSHVHSFLVNLGNPVQLINDVLEAKPRRAGDTLMRLVVNTTFGIGGIFDVATDWGWPDHENDGGMTFAVWGLGDGPYLFLPILGPSSPRDAAGFASDFAVSPFSWIGVGTVAQALSYTKTAASAVDARANVIDALDKITSQALDPYATIRSLYRQHRDSQIEDLRADNRRTVPAWFPAAAAPGPTPAPGATKP